MSSFETGYTKISGLPRVSSLTRILAINILYIESLCDYLILNSLILPELSFCQCLKYFVLIWESLPLSCLFLQVLPPKISAAKISKTFFNFNFLYLPDLGSRSYTYHCQVIHSPLKKIFWILFMFSLVIIFIEIFTLIQYRVKQIFHINILFLLTGFSINVVLYLP